MIILGGKVAWSPREYCSQPKASPSDANKVIASMMRQLDHPYRLPPHCRASSRQVRQGMMSAVPKRSSGPYSSREGIAADNRRPVKESKDHGECHRSQWQFNVKAPAPGQRVGEQPANQWSAQGSNSLGGSTDTCVHRSLLQSRGLNDHAANRSAERTRSVVLVLDSRKGA